MPKAQLLFALVFAPFAAHADASIDAKPVAQSSQWVGIAASRARSGAIAVWSPRHVRLSLDDGHTFGDALPGDGTIAQVALGRDGTLYAVRGARLDVRSPDGRDSFAELPFPAASTDSLVAGAGWIAWIGASDDGEELAVSRDGGHTWHRSAAPSRGNVGYRAFLDDDGTIQVMTASEAACGGGGQSRQRGHIDGRAFADLSWPLDNGSWQIGAGGWAYAVDYEDRRLNGVRDGAAIPFGEAGSTSDSFTVASNGRVTLATRGNTLLRLRGAGATVVARDVPADLQALTVDAAGNALGLLDGHPVRRVRTGWQPLVVGAP